MEETKKEDTTFVSINDLQVKPYEYLDKNITVRAITTKNSKGAYKIFEPRTTSEIWGKFIDNVSDINITINEEYYWSGILKYGDCGESYNTFYIELYKTEWIPKS